jgi:hypothetical protein
MSIQLAEPGAKVRLQRPSGEVATVIRRAGRRVRVELSTGKQVWRELHEISEVPGGAEPAVVDTGRCPIKAAAASERQATAAAEAAAAEAAAEAAGTERELAQVKAQLAAYTAAAAPAEPEPVAASRRQQQPPTHPHPLPAQGAARPRAPPPAPAPSPALHLPDDAAALEELEEAAALEEQFFAEYAAAHFPPGLGFTLGRDFRISPDLEHWERLDARPGGTLGEMERWEPRGTLAEYADAIAADPNLAGVGSLLELHFRLARLSAMLVATDPPASAFKQLTFPASPVAAHPNPVFRPNMFKKAFGTDMVRMGDYYRYAVKSESHCLAALEEECSNEPSVVLHPDHRWDDGTPPGMGGLLHGGFQCVGNLAYLQAHNVVAVVNTAKGLGGFFRKFPRMVAKAKAAGIAFYECGWVDAHEQVIGEQTLSEAILFIHCARTAGGSVLVHCAQGKSRSGTVSTAYVATVGGLAVEPALALVQEGRRMAQPNSNFMEQLLAFERDGVFRRLRDELAE